MHAQSRHFQPSVIGKAVVAITFLHPTRLDKGIALKRVGCFGYVVVTVDVCQRQNVELVAKDGTYLRQFMRIVGGKHQRGCLLLHDVLYYDIKQTAIHDAASFLFYLLSRHSQTVNPSALELFQPFLATPRIKPQGEDGQGY